MPVASHRRGDTPSVGAWGTGIFDGDTAADVRDDWREALLDGLEPEAATARVLERHRDALRDADDEVVVWLALAAAQAQAGRLLPEERPPSSSSRSTSRAPATTRPSRSTTAPVRP